MYVTSTFKRPVPLKHYLFYEGQHHEILVDGKFHNPTYRQLIAKQKEKESKNPHMQYKYMAAKLKTERQQWVWDMRSLPADDRQNDGACGATGHRVRADAFLTSNLPR